MICRILKQTDIPSAFQLRVAGCKGMVAIDPDSTMDDFYIHIRQSMIKFDSNDWNLEVCEISRPCSFSFLFEDD
jgi:RNA-dependent RNA polymerase